MRRCQNTEGGTMPNLGNALQQLREEHIRAQLRVGKLDQAISMIESLNGTGTSRRSSRPTRIVSAVSRRKMAQAQLARWERMRARNVVSIASKRGKSTISAAGKKRIAAAQRRRWAKVRAAKK
jgi:phage major head subunit gpT-like protein